MNNKPGLFSIIIVLAHAVISTQSMANHAHENVKQEYTIGVKLINGHYQTHQEWDEIANYLSTRLNVKFSILPVESDTLPLAMTKRLVDFVITDPIDTLKLPDRHKIKLLATALPAGDPFVFIIPAHKEIMSLESLADRPLFSRYPDEYYGWILPASLILSDSKKGSSKKLNVSFVDSISSVIDGVVLNDHAVGILSHISAKEMLKTINIKETPLKIVHPDISPQLPHWIFAALASVDRELSEQVSASLLSLTPEEPAMKTANLSYWTLPEDQRAVIALARKLDIINENLLQDITFSDLINDRPEYLVVVSIITGTLLACILMLLVANRKLRLHIKNKGFEATHDKMTRLLNHGAFIEELEKIKHSEGNPNTEYALMYIDLDNFKPINDQCGHDTGDNVLIQVADAFRTNVRESDIIGRLGGDEFAILFSRIQSQDIAMVAKNIIQKVNQVVAINPKTGARLKVGCSIGIVPFTRSSAKYISLVKKADAAMYRAKQQGKNRYHLSVDV